MIKKILVTLLIFILLTASVGYYLWLPKHQGVFLHNRNYEQVTILRDEFGIPHISSVDLTSVQYGLGYAQCQDRLWNMDIFRRIPSGRMSELLGDSTLSLDITMRELGLGRAARAMKQHLTKEAEAHLQAYADGINDCVDSMTILPVEYQLTRTSFAKWEIEDSLYFMKLLNLSLSADWCYEIMREKIKIIYGQELAAEMLGNSRNFDETYIMSDEELKLMNLFQPVQNQTAQERGELITLETIDKIMKSGMIDILIEGRGSNGWAISGNHTTTGKPIVANDPHLDNYIPSMWSQAVLHFTSKKGFKQTISGGSMPGSGFLLSGMTNYFAWSVTTLYNDFSDLFKEKINEQGTHYYLDGEWQALSVVDEPIQIKGASVHELKVKSTHRGPILNQNGLNVSFAWPGALSSDKTVNCLIDFYHLDSFEELKEALHKADGPPQAVSFGTIDNHIGFFGNGRHPIRNIPNSGTFVQDGTTRANDWIRYNTPSEQPRLYDPPKGFVVTANNKFASDNSTQLLSGSVATTARARRIHKIIETYIKNGTKISPQDVMNMQRDVLDSFAEKIHPDFMSLYHKEKKNVLKGEDLEKCEEMMKILQEWDFCAEKESVGATIYYAIDLFQNKKLIPQYSEDLLERQQVTSHFLFDHFKLHSIVHWAAGEKENETWCQNSNSTLPLRHCIYNFITSINDARKYLEEKLGSKVEQWQYGKLHNHSYNHIPFSKTFLKTFYERQYPSKGSRFTVHVSKKDFAKDSWKGLYGGNLKVISSLSQEQDSFYIIDTGISGNIFSPHYDDQYEIYKNGGYIKVARDSSKINNPKTLVIQKRNSPTNKNQEL